MSNRAARRHRRPRHQPYPDHQRDGVCGVSEPVFVLALLDCGCWVDVPFSVEHGEPPRFDQTGPL
jgi:hypothetical protein